MQGREPRNVFTISGRSLLYYRLVRRVSVLFIVDKWNLARRNLEGCIASSAQVSFRELVDSPGYFSTFVLGVPDCQFLAL